MFSTSTIDASPATTTTANPDSSGASSTLLGGVLGGIGGTILIVAGLIIYFIRHRKLPVHRPTQEMTDATDFEEPMHVTPAIRLKYPEDVDRPNARTMGG